MKKPSPMSYLKTLIFRSEPISRIQPQNGSHSSFSFREDNDFPKKPLIRKGTTTTPPRLIGSKTGKNKSVFFFRGSAKESKKVVQSFWFGKTEKDDVDFFCLDELQQVPEEQVRIRKTIPKTSNWSYF